ncbi:MAG TPA: sulfotransferase family 2 domain-containing protein [Candidatus Paceibacterota bacterium]|nr:sulfotransferase family 2 domain-containing protein [Candidatus Paceibacterota bacterium]
MLISEQKKFIFVHNQKTGGVSIANYLRDQAQDCITLLPNHAYAIDGISKIGRGVWDQHYSFGFVRNPWSRLVSWYQMIVNPPQKPENSKGQWTPNNGLWKYVQEHSSTFEEFLDNCTDIISENRDGFIYQKSFTKNQIDYFTDASGTLAVNFVGRFEQLQEDFDKVTTALNLPQTKLPILNVGPTTDYRTFYTERTKQLVAERFKKDIEIFGYSF